MKARKSTVYFSTVLFFILMHFVVRPASAQTQEVRLEDLTKKADVIARGNVTNVQSEWSSDKTRIFTKVTLAVDEYVKGEKPERTLVITHLGGEVNGVGELYTHTPRFAKGEEVLVFGKKDRKNNLIVTGGDAGKVLVTKDKLTGEKMVQGGLTLKMFTSTLKSIVEQQKIK